MLRNMTQNCPKIHVPLAGVAVPHHRAEEHLDEERLGEDLAQDLPGGELVVGGSQVVVVEDTGEELGEAVALAREGPRDFGGQEVDVVAEPQPHARKGDLRPGLRGEREVVPTEAELAEELRERPFAAPFGCEVRDRVQADVVIAASQAIERIEPADRVVPFEDRDLLIVERKPDAGGQPRHAGAVDVGVVGGSKVNDATRCE
jgi:hypothetical protein